MLCAVCILLSSKKLAKRRKSGNFVAQKVNEAMMVRVRQWVEPCRIAAALCMHASTAGVLQKLRGWGMSVHFRLKLAVRTAAAAIHRDKIL